MSGVPIVGTLAPPAFSRDPDTGIRFARAWSTASDDRDLRDRTRPGIRDVSRRHARCLAMDAQGGV